MWSAQASAYDFHNCSDEEIDKIAGAAAVAETVMRIAEADLNSIEDGGDATRFETYLGSPATSERTEHVRQMLYAIWQGSMANAAYYCNRACPGGANAFSEQGSALGNQKTYPVYLCERFMDDDELNTYDRAATLIHEYLHHYGAWDPDFIPEDWDEWARDLAETSPNTAISSAWNLQFYIDQ
jgi:hypothetical protein